MQVEDGASEPPPATSRAGWDGAAWLRFVWTCATAFAAESLFFGVAVLAGETFWEWHLRADLAPHGLRVLVLAMALVPAYLIFAVVLMFVSALGVKLLGWRPPERAELRILDLDWELCNWARYSISLHVVRIFAGILLRATPLWTWYMRLNGARLGHGVWVNSLDVTDHCLLDFGDDVVIGAGVHLSGHTVERGMLRTARVQLARGVTVGVNANVEIGVEAGPNCQIGALSVVPKFAKLEGHTTYVGIPVRPLR